MYSVRIGARKSGPPTLNAAVQMIFYNAAGGQIASTLGSTVALSGTADSWVTHTALAPPGTTQVDVEVRFRDGTIAIGDYCYARNWMMVEYAEAVPYFDGGSSLTGYTCTWQGAADASTSLRTPLAPLDAREPESLVWRADQSGMDFLAPLVQVAGYRLVCDESRQWTLRSGTYVADGALTFAVGADITEATDTLSRAGDDWFDAQVTKYVWETPTGAARSRVDAWALSGSPTKTNYVEVRAPYPGTGRSQYAVKRAQGRGRVVQVSKVSDWTARAEQPVTVVLFGAPTQTGLSELVEFNLDRDEVTVTTRTTDTLPGSIDLLGGTIDALVGVINDL
jgi:hypothetical protein